jgi:hypothetical protein
MGPHSDFDMLVVMPDRADCRAVIKQLYRKLRGLNQAKDLVAVREGDMDQHSADPYLVFMTHCPRE